MITKAPLTVTLGGSKIYDGDTTVTDATAKATATGLVAGDSDTGGYSFSGTASANVGTYTVGDADATKQISVTPKITNIATSEDRTASYGSSTTDVTYLTAPHDTNYGPDSSAGVIKDSTGIVYAGSYAITAKPVTTLADGAHHVVHHLRRVAQGQRCNLMKRFVHCRTRHIVHRGVDDAEVF